MRNRAAVVTFKRKVFEEWMDIFAKYDWQKDFSLSEIREGMVKLDQISIKGVEMRPESIVLRFIKEDKSPYFVIIEWDGNRLLYRLSDPESSFGAIVSCLVLDEIFLEKQEVILSQAETEEDPDLKSIPFISPDSNNDNACDRLRLSFYLSGQNLCFRSYWNSSNKLVFPDNFTHNRHSLSQEDKSAVIKLVHLSRKAGFILNKKSKEYQITHLPNAIDFCKSILPKWKQYFIIQCDQNVQKLEQVPSDIDIVFQSYEPQQQENFPQQNSSGIKLRLLANGTPISESTSRKLLRSNSNLFFIENIGVVSLNRSKVKAIQEYNETVQRFQGDIPRYMLYSLFCHPEISYQNDPDLLKWQQSFNSAPKKPFILPKILRSYQREGVLWINHILTHNFHGLLADDMGLGKTLQVLTFISKMDPAHQSIIICPASVVDVWKNEAEKFFPKINVRIFSSSEDINDPEVNAWIVSYTQLRRNKSIFAKKEFQLTVLDEAQFIKNPNTKVFHACTFLKSQWRLALSGTPIENNILDLWSIFRFLMPGLLGEKKAFLNLIKNDDIIDKVKKQIAPFMLRRTKENVVSELPQKIEINVFCEMTPMQQHLYKNIIQKTLQNFKDQNNHFDFKNHSFGILSALTRLRQIACDPGIIPNISATLEDSCKLNTLSRLLHREFENPSNKKIVIFSQFVSFLHRIKSLLIKEFPQIPVLEIIGSTKNRNHIVQNFQSLDSSAIILVSLKAGGVGITLTAAESVYIMDPWWNPSTEKQAMDRVHRIGQNKSVSVYRFITQNSIESNIQILQKKKNSLFGEIIDSLKIQQDGINFFLQNIEELIRQEEI